MQSTAISSALALVQLRKYSQDLRILLHKMFEFRHESRTTVGRAFVEAEFYEGIQSISKYEMWHWWWIAFLHVEPGEITGVRSINLADKIILDVHSYIAEAAEPHSLLYIPFFASFMPAWFCPANTTSMQVPSRPPVTSQTPHCFTEQRNANIRCFTVSTGERSISSLMGVYSGGAARISIHGWVKKESDVCKYSVYS